MKKQIQIAKWLKGLCILMAVCGVVFFGGLIYYMFSPIWFVEDAHHILLIFTLAIAVMSYAILYQFWKVCCEIEKDNSFSLENAKSFRVMALLGIGFLADYVLRLIYDLIVGFSNPLPVIFAAVMIVVSIIFIVVCEALSQLIKNAYEVKLENELTI